jgi:hypothetical protein
MRNIRRLGSQHRSDDPLEGLANFFDLGVVFALGLLVVGLASISPELLKSSATNRLSALPKDTVHLDHYEPSDQQLGGEGEKLGVAYRLKSGEVIYVPDRTNSRPEQ